MQRVVAVKKPDNAGLMARAGRQDPLKGAMRSGGSEMVSAMVQAAQELAAARAVEGEDAADDRGCGIRCSRCDAQVDGKVGAAAGRVVARGGLRDKQRRTKDGGATKPAADRWDRERGWCAECRVFNLVPWRLGGDRHWLGEADRAAEQGST